jgi:hypothetical protein
MANNKFIYRITVTNFNKYNSTLKKGHKSTLISNNFCSDPKLGTLPMTTRWMFLGIVLTCGDFTRDTVEMSSKALRNLLECNRDVDRELYSLQSLQVLTFEKIDPFMNRIEKKVKESKRKEENIFIAEIDDPKNESENSTLDGPSTDPQISKPEVRRQIEKIYNDHYPLKKGKSKGVEKLSKELKSEKDFADLVIAITRYKAQLTDPQFALHFSTFAGQWRDCLDPDYGKTTVEKKPIVYQKQAVQPLGVRTESAETTKKKIAEMEAARLGSSGKLEVVTETLGGKSIEQALAEAKRKAQEAREARGLT